MKKKPSKLGMVAVAIYIVLFAMSVVSPPGAPFWSPTDYVGVSVK